MYGKTSAAAAIIIFLLNFPFGQDGINDATVLAYIILARALTALQIVLKMTFCDVYPLMTILFPLI